MASTVLPNGIIIPEKFSRDWYADLYHNWEELDNLLGGGTPKDGTLTIQKNGSTVGTFSANQATDETIDITVPDVNDGTLTIQQNGTTVDTFTANSSTDKTVNITVPTKTSDLTNDSDFVQSSDLATVATSGNYNDLSNKPTIPTVNNATLTIQKNGTNVQTFTANQSTNATANITVPTKTSELTNDSGFLTSHQSLSNYVTLNSTQTITATKTISANLNFSTTYTRGTTPSSAVEKELIDYKDSAGNRICLFESAVNSDKRSLNAIYAYDTSVASGSNIGYLGIGSKADGTVFTHSPTPPTSDNSTQIATTEWAIPRSGGAVITPNATIGCTNNNGYLNLSGGTGWNTGATVNVVGQSCATNAGMILLHPYDGTQGKTMYIKPNGTWTWDGTACQIISDQRYKQQIDAIDDKLLDAWEDVDLVQFKYNDAVDQKGDNARLHTGYVVQQIQKACESHGVDISQYGLFCHEEYPEETEEVEVENEDGTKTKERKVIREASEHYSLRYTEALIIECKYLRRCVERLTARIEELEKGNKEAEK